jgi:hypothetical protein
MMFKIPYEFSDGNLIAKKSISMSIFILFLFLFIITGFAGPFIYSPALAANEKPAYPYQYSGRDNRVEYSMPPYDYSDYYINASNIARVTVLIDGTRAKIYSHRGEYFIEGRMGRNYTLLITSRMNRRIKVSAAVDGLDVIDGRRASYDKPGYIITPYSNANIKGWRISDGEVASFKFGPISESYAMKMDSPSEIGVISFGFFAERRADIYVEDYNYIKYRNEGGSYKAGRAAAAGAAESKKAPADSSSKVMAESAQSIGTEFGDRRDSRISHTNFEAETSYPQAVVKINYASYEDLVRRGIIGGGDIIIQDYKPPVRKYEKDGLYSRPPEDWRK